MSDMFVPYGNFWAGDALYNLRIGIYGIEGAFRFIAKDTVPVNKIRYFNTYSFSKPGYHLGTGGKIRIEIQEDDNSVDHLPSGKSLAYALVENPLTSPEHLLVDFNQTTILEKGKFYHIVFINYDVNPEANHVSIDMMATFANKPVNVPDQPECDILDMTTLWRDKYNRKWRRFKDNQSITPIFSLFYSVSSISVDNIAFSGYGGMESWVREPRYIEGSRAVRQRFVPVKDVPIENVAVRIAKNGTPKNLKLSLISGTVLEQGEIKHDLIKLVDTKILPGFRVGHDWVKYTFKNPHVLTKGKEYFLTLNADSGDAYEVFPLRDGASFGYASIWDNSWAEYTTQGDKGWTGWDAWGNKNLKLGDLQLYFNSKL